MAATNATGATEPDLAGQLSIDEEKESDRIKKRVLQGLLEKNVNLSNFELGELLGFKQQSIEKVREMVQKKKLDPKGDKCYSWDYVLAFDIGDDDIIQWSKEELEEKADDDNHEEWEKGSPRWKKYGQIINVIWMRLEDANLKVDGFRSREWPTEASGGDADGGGSGDDGGDSVDRSGVTFFLLVGITENNLKHWADFRNTDLLLDPKGACTVGRARGFPLAKRTLLTDEDDPEKCKLSLSLWYDLYGEYSQAADPRVYKHYPRLKGNEDLMTPFDERTRLRIIYETMIGDNEQGGAEIKIEDWIHNKNHPLKAVFALHDPDKQEEFRQNWIKNWSLGTLMSAPLNDIRAYFGEPVAFYYGFLLFYLRWLVAPAAVGLIFFIWQMGLLASGESVWIAVDGLPIMGLFMIFWCVAFVDFWYRQEARYRQQWGMSKFEEKAVARPQFKGEWRIDAVTGLRVEDFSFIRRGLIQSVVYTVITIFMSLCVLAVVVVLLERDSNPTDTEWKIFLGCVNSVMIIVFDMIYKFISQYGNDVENHRTDQDYQDNMIRKSFVFRLVNSFSSLVFLAYIRPMANEYGYYIRYYGTSDTGVCGGEGPDYMSNMFSAWINNYTDSNITDSFDFDTYGDRDTSSGFYKCAEDPVMCYDKDWQSDNTKDLNDEFTAVYKGFNLFDTLNETEATSVCGDWGLADTPVNDDGTWACDVLCDEADMLDDRNQVIMFELMIQLVTLFLTAIVIQNTLEVGVPFLKEFIAAKMADEEEEEKSEAEIQMEKGRYANTIDDMSEMIVQFGYVTLFVMAFPLIPLLAIINNIFEIKVDAVNLVMSSQRPDPNGSDGIGTWNSVLGMFSILSVANNALLITSRTNLLSTVIADSGENVKLWFFCIFSIFLAVIVAIEKTVIPDVPLSVEQAQERQRLVEEVLIKGTAVDDDQTSSIDILLSPHSEGLDVIEQTKKVPISVCTADPEVMDA